MEMCNMEELKEIRKIISELDEKIIENLSLRFNAVQKVTEIKKKYKLPIFDYVREEEIIQNIINNEMGNTFYVAEIYEQILKISRKYQSQNLLPKKIFLTGFMGSGKSTVGKLLSKITGFQLIDTDTMIEEKMKMNIAYIFEKKGEEHFRKLETEMLENIDKESNQIISCGGGIIIKEENRKMLKEKGTVVFLNARIKTMLDRLEKDYHRPLLLPILNENDDKKYSFFKDLLDKRMPHYMETSDIVINIENKLPEDVAKEIINKLI